MSEQDLASLSKIDIGRVLAMSLRRSCRMEHISAEERSLLVQAEDSIDKYFIELLALAGFAQDYAIVKLLGNRGAGKEVRDGYLEVGANFRDQSAFTAAVYDIFVRRCPEYAKAADRMEPGDIDPIGLLFGGFLAPESGHAQILAMTYASAVFFRTSTEPL